MNLINFCRNELQTAEDVRELSQCLQLSVLDLSNNKLEEEEVLDIFSSMPELHVLSVARNQIIRVKKEYR